MTPFLLRSGLLHAAALGLVFAFFALHRPSKKVFYTIDFLGGLPGEAPGGGGAKGGPSPATAPVPAKAPSKPASKDEPLPSLSRWRAKAKASTLREAELAVKSKSKDAPQAVEPGGVMGTSRKDPAPAGTGGGAPGAGSGASVSADLTNFPYPWYLARLRDSLWTQWSERMPPSADLCVVSFVVARDGKVAEVSVSESSGDSTFDYAAMSAVQAAAPFPPLPDGYSDPTLKVHVRFESQ